MFETYYSMASLRRPMKVVLYGRVASSDQSQERADDQLDAIKRFIEEKRLPWKIAIAYRGVHQRNIKDALKDIASVIEDRGIEDVGAIVVTTFDRISRCPPPRLEREINGAKVDIIATEMIEAT